MPTLPTLTVTQEQAERMLAVWGGTAQYKQWLKESIVAYVSDYEFRQSEQAIKDEARSRVDTLRTELEGL